MTIPPTYRPGQKPGGRPKTTFDEARARELLAEGQSLRQVARTLCISVGTLHRRIKSRRERRPQLERERPICFYCGALISGAGTGQGDHFPLSVWAGGLDCVPCCSVCHDMKDHFNLESWPVGWIEKVIDDFPRLSRETKLFLAKSMRLILDHGQTAQRPLHPEPPDRTEAESEGPRTPTAGDRIRAVLARAKERGTGSG